jgi:hypothetical protein
LAQIFIVSGTTWTVPADWNPSSNTIETIGGGGGGQTADTNFAGSGGGGGGYSKITNLVLTPGNSMTIQIGTGGAAGQAGGDTWFNAVSLAASSVGAKGGGGGADNAGGPGAAAAAGVGATKYSGGNGGTQSSTPYGAAGGGGAAGPDGNGSNGGHYVLSTGVYAGTGGGGNGGGSSTAGANPVDPTGGAGGTAQDGTAGGAGGVQSSSPGQPGSRGSGGGGGARDGSAPANGAAGNGGDGVEFDPTHGSGGGGGGGGSNTSSAGNGGAGGKYGGGGGGGAYPSATGGTGGDGIIVITYTSAASTTVTADAWAAFEFQEMVRTDDFSGVEFVAPARGSASLAIEPLLGIQRDAANAIEFFRVARGDLALLAEWAGTLAITADVLVPVEFALLLRSDTITLTEFSAGTLRDANTSIAWPALQRIDCGMTAEQLAAEWVDFFLPSEAANRCAADAWFCVEWPRALAGEAGAPIEMAAVLGGEVSPVLEALTSGALVWADMMLSVEFADPPQLVLVSLERVRRSPGKIRILAAAGSTHPLRGQ